MAKISLRAYNREIENLIEGGQIDEAIAHCRHILSQFPKHVDTYRLLGKAFLESQRYGDAVDIFQRVLSAVPDDFISNVGMSIIREDEGRLDEAIWHMERAYEVQPNNGAIQEELRRLYGRRDGVEPPKIRLTRGALARMYWKGEHYQQAAAEARAALAESQNRLDLELLLAQVNAAVGKKAEAAESLNHVLRKLPFCLQANRLMSHVLKDSERAESTQVYRNRVTAMDPYEAHIPPGGSASDVPDAAVSLERFVYRPGAAYRPGGQPEWAASLGVQIGDSDAEKEAIPDWLQEPEDEDRPAEASAPDEAGEEEVPGWPPDDESSVDPAAELATEDEIPDWLKEAGWGPNTGEAQEGHIDFEEEEADLGPEDLSPAEMPEWLKEMAPEDQAETGEPVEADEDFSWLDAAAAGAAGGAIEQEVPDWLKDFEEETGQEGSEAAPDLPDWLSSETPDAGEDAVEDVPDWLQSLGAGAEAVPPKGMTESDTEETDLSPADAAETPAERAGGEEIPDWLKDFESDTKGTAAPTGQQADVPAEEAPSWLEEMPEGAEAGIEAQSGEADLESRAEEKADQEAVEPAGSDWLLESEWEDQEAEPATEIPDWLQEPEGAQEIGVEALDDSGEAPSEPAEEAPEVELRPEAMDIPAAEIPEVPVEEPEAAPAEASLDDADAAFAWLESLAVKQGASEALLLDEDERIETPPDWVRQAVEQTAESPEEQPEAEDDQPAEAEVTEPPVAVEAQAEPAEELPEWLRRPVETAEPESEEPKAVEEEISASTDAEPAEEFPDWLRGPISEAEGEEVEIAELPPALKDRQDIPDAAEAIWQTMETGTPESLDEEESLEEDTQPVRVIPASEEKEDLELLETDLVDGEEAVDTAEQAVELEPPAAEVEAPSAVEEPEAAQKVEEDDAFAWLESLAVKQGASEALLLGEEERRETPPEWVRQAAEEEPEALESELEPDLERAAEAEAFQPEPEAPVVPEGPVAVEEEPEAAADAPEPEDARDWVKDEETAEAEPEEEALPEPPERVQEADQEVEEIAEGASEEPLPELPDWLAGEAPEEREEERWLLTGQPYRPDRQEFIPIDVNEASLAELERVPGIGFILAQSIVAHRERHGLFRSVDDLNAVPGISEATLDYIRNRVMVSGVQEPEPEPEPEPAPSPGRQEPVDRPAELEAAYQAIFDEGGQQAAGLYSGLIKERRYLPEIIRDLEDVLEKRPEDVFLWQSLGDAYLRSDRIQEALDAYTQAEKLLH